MKEVQQPKDPHAYDFRLMLRDIDCREKAAEKWGAGQKDVVVSLFLHRLENPRLPRCRLAREVYRLRREGLSSQETASALGISEADVRKAERYLLSLYGRSCRQAGTRRPRFEGEYLLFRRDVTGATDYRMLSRDGVIGRAHYPVTSGFPPVTLHRNALVLNSHYPAEQTIAPGVSRIIIDADNGEEYARLTYLGTDDHGLRLNWDTDKRMFHIHRIAAGAYRVTLDGELYAHLFWSKGEPARHQWEQRYKLHVYQPVADDLIFLLLSFPFLRFL